MNKRQERVRNWVVGIVLVLGIAAVSSYDFFAARMGWVPDPDESVGKTAIAFEATTLDGQKIAMPADFRGKYVLLDFWATWCGPCRAEIPHLKAAYERFADDGLVILGINLDKSSGGTASSIKSFLESNQMSWPQVFETSSDVADRYGVRSIPTAYLIDGDTGEIVAGGRVLSGPYLETTLEEILHEKTSTQSGK